MHLTLNGTVNNWDSRTWTRTRLQGLELGLESGGLGLGLGQEGLGLGLGWGGLDSSPDADL